VFVKEKHRLDEMLLTDNGQQQLAMRTFRIQLSQQSNRINTLHNAIEQVQREKNDKRHAALEVRQWFMCKSMSSIVE
jgi:hypothetical protein